MWYIIIGGAVVIGFVLSGNGGQITEKVCDPQTNTLHEITYDKAFTGGKGRKVSDKDTGVICPCEVTGVNGFIASPHATGYSLSPRKEGNCHSPNTQGQPEPIPNQAAPGSTGGFGGGGNTGGAPGENPGPPPAPKPWSPVLAGTRPRSTRAVTPGSAFTYTLPFRELPAGPLFTGTLASPTPTCNDTLNPTFFRVYHTDNVVRRYNLCTGQIVATIKVPALPLQVKVTPDGSTAVVTSYGGAITFIDTATNQISGTIPVSAGPNFTPSGVAISPDGAYALVTNYEAPPDSYLLVVDLATQRVTNRITLNHIFPQSVFINPDGTLAWITYPWADTVEVMDILTGTIVRTFTVTEPFSMVFNATGTQVFLASGAGSVQVIDTKTYQLIKTLPADLGATDLQLSGDGAFVFVNNSLAKSVTVIETASLTATTTAIAGTPLGAVLVPTK